MLTIAEVVKGEMVMGITKTLPAVGDLLGTGERGLVILLEMEDHTKVAVKHGYYGASGNRSLQHEHMILSLIHARCIGMSGIPRVYPWMHEDGLAMEYIEGEVIADVLMNMGDDLRSHRAILGYITELLGIFAQLHAIGVVHKDIHDHNILLSTAGHVHVIDFGLALYQPHPKRYRLDVSDLWTLTQTWIEIHLQGWPFQGLVLGLYNAWYECLPPQQLVYAADLLAAWQAIMEYIFEDVLK
jgi:serine/threonine protein kinase